jgi:hypothetical protein
VDTEPEPVEDDADDGLAEEDFDPGELELLDDVYVSFFGGDQHRHK